MTDPIPTSPTAPTSPTTPISPTTVTGTGTVTPVAPAPRITVVTSGSGGGLLTLLLSGAVLAAVITGIMTTALARRSTRLEERDRVRRTLAEAYQAYADYKEFPYAIRRRRADQPAAERIRLSEALREVQSRLSYYQAWTLAESPQTGAAYNALVTEGRRVAGTAMRDAWLAPPLDDDRGMNLGSTLVDLSGLATAEKAFTDAVHTHVSALTTPAWRRAWTRLTSGPDRAVGAVGGPAPELPHPASAEA